VSRLSALKDLFSKATLSKVFGGTGLGTRVGVAGAYLGAATIGSTALGYFAENQKAYYGESRYNSYYGSGAETTKSLVWGLGILGAGKGILGRDLYSRFKMDIAHRTGLPNTAPKLGWKYLLGNAALISGAAYGIEGRVSALSYIGGAAAGTLGVAGLGIAAYKAPGTLATLAIGGTIGAYAGSHGNTNMAEGNIIDMQKYSDSVVRRMNYNTAGLVQALHKNRRMS
jgi:hypothetical protein